jgi:hypothetical protein
VHCSVVPSATFSCFACRLNLPTLRFWGNCGPIRVIRRYDAVLSGSRGALLLGVGVEGLGLGRWRMLVACVLLTGKPCAAGRVARECLRLLNPMLCSGLFQTCVQRPQLQRFAHGPDLNFDATRYPSAPVHARAAPASARTCSPHAHCRRCEAASDDGASACLSPVPRVPRTSMRLCAHADAPPVPLSFFILLSFIPSVRASRHPSARVSLSRARIVPCVVFVSLERLSAVKSGACTLRVGISSRCHKPYYRTGSVRFCPPRFFPPLLPASPSLSR